jgi:hypothetical protein
MTDQKKSELYQTLYITLNDYNIKTDEQRIERINKIIKWIEDNFIDRDNVQESTYVDTTITRFNRNY